MLDKGLQRNMDGAIFVRAIGTPVQFYS